MFKFQATSFISRNPFYISSIFKVKVNDMLNDNVRLIEHDDNKEQVRQAEFVSEIPEIGTIGCVLALLYTHIDKTEQLRNIG